MIHKIKVRDPFYLLIMIIYIIIFYKEIFN
jgi:hypothetical protein